MPLAIDQKPSTNRYQFFFKIGNSMFEYLKTKVIVVLGGVTGFTGAPALGFAETRKDTAKCTAKKRKT